MIQRIVSQRYTINYLDDIVSATFRYLPHSSGSNNEKWPLQSSKRETVNHRLDRTYFHAFRAFKPKISRQRNEVIHDTATLGG